MNWKWKKESILNNYDENTDCKEIFKATCDEIGEYFSKKGWKYSKSKPKITFKNKSIKFEISFWSSRSNTPGEYVNLEIIPTFISLDLIKKLKNEEISSKGFLGFPNFYRLSEKVPKGREQVIKVFGESINKDSRYNENKGIIIYSNNINIYNISEIEFLKIIDFIETQITSWIEWSEDYQKLVNFYNYSLSYHKKQMIEQNFQDYMTMKFPDKEIEILKNIK